MIRFLTAGETVPDSPPRRYTKGQRYVRLRWKIGIRHYVEVWEHRVVNGKITTAIRHHKNHNKQDNSPDNLLDCATDAEHSKEHRRYNHEEIASLYRGGMSIPQLAIRFNAHAGTITHILHGQNVTMRFGKGKPGNRLGFRKARPNYCIPGVGGYDP